MTDELPRIDLYTPRPMVTMALQRLGKRLAAQEQLSPEENGLYEDLIRDAKDRVVGVQEFCESMFERSQQWHPRLQSADIVGRVKTLNTLSEKLARTPQEKLPAIHDVAGVRVVADMSLMEQRAAVSLLSKSFDKIVSTSRPSRVIDRLKHPMHGYRAMHLIVWPGGRPVEIQVRTELQHAWAQYMEVIGDRWGREARYGLPVVGTNARQRRSREEVITWMKTLSEAIAAYEEAVRNTGLLHLKIDDSEFVGIDPEVLRELREKAEQTDIKLAGTRDTLRTLLSSLPKNIAG